MRVLSCGAPYGEGGLGGHLRQLVEEERASGHPFRYLCLEPRRGDPAGERVALGPGARLAAIPPLRMVPAWRSAAFCIAFDQAAGAALPRADTVTAFAGQALTTFGRARRGRTGVTLHLESPTAHVRTVARQHHAAAARLPVEGPWLGSVLSARTVAEYAAADICWVPSSYAYGSFVDAGMVPERLRIRRLRVDTDHFRPPVAEPRDGVFRVLYVGALTAAKGVGVLLEAFRRFSPRDAELVLVGGWASAGMRRHLQAARQWDPRIRLPGAGDPLPHYRQASVYVHASYQDGFGLAPLEAAACGLPVIVTRDTGMKDLLADGDSGYIVRTGDPHAIAERLEVLYHSPAQRMRMGAAARAAAVQWCSGAGALGATGVARASTGWQAR